MKTILLKPFEKYQETQLLAIGSLATIIGGSIAYILGGRFDGVLDFHLDSNISIPQAILDSSINIVCLVLLLFIAAKYLNVKTRLIDIITTVIIARIPLYFVPLLTIGGKLKAATTEIVALITPENIQNIQGNIPTESLVIVMIFAIVSLLFLIWSIALMYNGYKTATNAKGKKAIVLFCIALLGAEILSKILIFSF
ncbi:MAG: hypothetical protein COB60_08205 [Flavobacteriaceae bacterium]|nr:MAG: hypothetical protein COB60_08205 [Flavobacteriaceae bacterium]